MQVSPPRMLLTCDPPHIPCPSWLPNASAMTHGCSPPSVAECEAHPITNILLDQNSVKDIRFSISKLLWCELPAFQSMIEDRYFGTFKQWLKTAERRPKIEWDDGGVDTALTLHDLLPAALGMQLDFRCVQTVIAGMSIV